MNAAILSTRRETSPFGLEGGSDAARGTTTIIRKNGTREILRGQDETNVAPGDCIEIATPGGGGFGKA
jgi:5-oxoprolinase (ATP-hydrolysing)